MDKTFRIGRRTLLQGVTGLAAASILPGALRAQDRSLIVASWGGDYARLLEAHVAPRLAQAHNLGFTLDTSDSGARKTKVTTAARLRRAASDVAFFNDRDMFQMDALGTMVPIDDLGLSRADDVLPNLRTTYSIPQIYSGMVIVYDPAQVTTPPTAVADLWAAEYRNRIGFSDILFTPVMMLAAIAHGGSATDFAPGIEALDDLKRTHAPRVYSSNEAIANAFHAQEISATLMWKARAYQWQKAGLSVQTVAPSEGILPVTFEAGVAELSSRKEAAAAFLDTILEPEAQLAFAQDMGYLPTTRTAQLSDEMRTQLGFTPAEEENFNIPDYEYVSRSISDHLAWWNQSFKA